MTTTDAPVSESESASDIAIIGAGFSGIGIAARLRERGFDDLRVFEAREGVGGTWRANHYPGCACDIPSHLYSLSFAPKGDWSRLYAPQAEILEYLEEATDRLGVRDSIRFGAQLANARWDEGDRRWHLAFADGSTHSARVLVSGMGGLTRPSIPNVEGLDEFEGEVFHSAEWRHDVDLDGARVAVIGTGASAIQFVPHVARRAAQVYVHQRTPPWVMPHLDRPISPLVQRLFTRVPLLRRAMRGFVWGAQEALGTSLIRSRRAMRALEARAVRNIERSIADPELRAKLTPNYRMGCKRILVSNDWYPALAQPHVEVVTDGIARVTPTGVVTADGVEREVDVIVLGTGFRPTDTLTPLALHGRDGSDINESWEAGLAAYRGTTVANLPNFFMLMGPNTGLGHNSQVFMIESQMNYVLSALEQMRAHDVHAIEVRRDVQDSYNANVQRRFAGTVWLTGGCQSWYLDRHGNNTTLWPGLSATFRRELRTCDLDEYELLHPPSGGAAKREPSRDATDRELVTT